MLAELRSKGSVTYAASAKCINMLSSIIDIIVDQAIDGVSKEFASVLDATEIPAKIQKFSTAFIEIKTVAPKFNSEYKIRRLYESHPFFVKPEDLLICERFVNKPTPNGVGPVSKCHIAQYVPIKNTIRALLAVPEYVNLIFPLNVHHHGVPEEYSSFKDGIKFKNSPLIKTQEYVLLFQLYEDGTGLTNPLSSSSTCHSSGVFCFSLLNLENSNNSSLNNIHLIAMAKNSDLKDHGGIDIIQEYIAQEMTEFESTGVEYILAGRGRKRIFGIVAHFTADNLAINQNFGLVESFSCDFCCAICYADRQQIQKCTREKHFKLRNRQDYDKDCKDQRESSELHVRGVKKYSLLR